MQFLMWVLAGVLLGPRTDPVLVQSVISGDTIIVASVGRVRLLGIEAPKPARGLAAADSLGQKAKDLLSGIVLRRWVRLETEGRGAMSARGAAYVTTEDGLFVNAAIVREGLARVTARQGSVRFDELRAAETDAQTLEKGIWNQPQLPPKSRRGRAVH